MCWRNEPTQHDLGKSKKHNNASWRTTPAIMKSIIIRGPMANDEDNDDDAVVHANADATLREYLPRSRSLNTTADAASTAASTEAPTTSYENDGDQQDEGGTSSPPLGEQEQRETGRSRTVDAQVWSATENTDFKKKKKNDDCGSDNSSVNSWEETIATFVNEEAKSHHPAGGGRASLRNPSITGSRMAGRSHRTSSMRSSTTTTSALCTKRCWTSP